jgi:predicted RNase H-like HicB family nuclease
MSRRAYFARIVEEPDNFTIDFPDLPGCITCGETRKEAIEMAKDALKVWLEYMKDKSKAIPAPSDLRELEGNTALRTNEDNENLKIEWVGIVNE